VARVEQQAAGAPAGLAISPIAVGAVVPDSASSEREVARSESALFASAAAADATAAEPSWDIEVHDYESTDRVEHYVQLFSGRAKEQVQAWLGRGTRYEGMIRSRMREGGIPEDMYYLALVESGFDQNAYSRAAAVGMWQFMTSTARDMGLRVDWWIDERRDPFKSTTAAVRFLKGLRDQFGSLYLAAAAYNGGPGRISRGLSRYADDLEGTTGDDLFFALAEKDYLRNETREYVPQLIAAALIAKEPARYGMKIDSLPPVTYDSVRVGPATALTAVARAANVPTDSIRNLNPHVLRAVTPPRDSFFVRVPTGTADSAAAALAAMPREDVRGLIVVESKKGESVASIAKKHGVTTRAVNLYNQKLTRLKSGNLAAGQLVYVPTTEVARVSISVPDPEIERYGSSSSGSTVTHVVRRGETLGGIALKYHTTTAALMTANGLRKPLIFAGQSLIVKGKASSTKSAPKRSTASKAAPKSSGKTSVAKKAPAKPTASKSTTAKASTAKTAKPASKPASTKASSAKSAAKTASKSPSKHNESH